jgi:hypothetical protein
MMTTGSHKRLFKKSRPCGIFFGQTLLLVFLMAATLLGKAQERRTLLNAGLEYKWYPAGQMVNLQTEIALPHATNQSLNASVGFNMAKRFNFSGLNDDEHGSGPGIALGYRYYFKPDKSPQGVYIGARTDLWWMNIDWIDNSHLPSSGQTRITVLQPTFELGYKQGFKSIDVFLGFVNGYEINVVTIGKEVGQGWITELQLGLAKRF